MKAKVEIILDLIVEWKHKIGEGKNETFTKCKIIQNNIFSSIEGKVIGRGKAVLSESDTFDEKFGRQISLERALKNAFPNDKTIRSQIWEQYENEFGFVKNNTQLPS
jgi:hypothetical protein